MQQTGYSAPNRRFAGQWRWVSLLVLTLGLGGCEFNGGIFGTGGIFGPTPDTATDSTTGTSTDLGTSTDTGTDTSLGTGTDTTTSPDTGTSVDDGTGTITAQVSGTIVIAVDADGRVLDVYDTSGRDRDLDRDGDGIAETYSVVLNNIPVNEPVQVYMFTDFDLVPISFANGINQGATNQLILLDRTTVDLGLLPKPVNTGDRVFSELAPDANPVVGVLSPVNIVPAGVNRPNTAGLSLDELNRRGLGALRDGWLLGARDYFAAARVLALAEVSNAADTAYFFHALSRVAAVGVDTLSDGDPSDRRRLGDLLDLFGYAADASRANLGTLRAADTLPVSAPTGAELQAFLGDVVAAELRGAITDLDRVSAQFRTGFTFPRLRADLDQVVEVDYGDVLAFRALFNAGLAAIALQQGYDLDVDFSQLDGLTIEAIVAQSPGFLSLAGSGIPPQAADYFRAALDDADRALAQMQQEVSAGDDQEDELFGYVDGTLSIPGGLFVELIDDPEAWVVRLRSAMDGPVEVSRVEGGVAGQLAETVSLDLGVLFRGVDFRSPTPALLPTFRANVPVGFLVDATLQGMFGYAGFDPNRDQDADGNADILDWAGVLRAVVIE